jgi:hypothetical protein
MEKKQTTAVTAGIILALILIVLALVTYFTGMYMQSWSQYIGFVIIVGGIIWAVTNHGKEKEYTETFGQLFSYGFKVTAVITCLMILYTLISGFVFPEIKEKIIEAARTQALKNPGANEDAIEQGMNMFAKNYNLFIILGILFWYLLMGVISSLIGAAITKKQPKNSFDQI